METPVSDLEKQRDVALEFVRNMAGGGIDERYFAKDMTVFTLATGHIPIRDYLPKLRRAKHVWKAPAVMTIDTVTQVPDRVVIQARGRGEPITGGVYTQDYLVMVEFNERDEIRHVREYFDMVRLEAVLRPAIVEYQRRQDQQKA
jgi:ketosteroid isomerase-like protein